MIFLLKKLSPEVCLKTGTLGGFRCKIINIFIISPGLRWTLGSLFLNAGGESGILATQALRDDEPAVSGGPFEASFSARVNLNRMPTNGRHPI